MRQLSRARPPAGFTLIEVLVVMAILALIVTAGAPALGRYVTGARLRTAALMIASQAAYARSEAMKSNTSMALTVKAGTVRVQARDAGAAAPQPSTAAQLAQHDVALPDGVVVDGFTIAYDSSGRPTPFGTELTVGVRSVTEPCSADLACPSVALLAGGAINLCAPGACP